MPSVIDLYERLASAPDHKARAKIIAEALEALEERYPNLSQTATQGDLRETELRLLKEIEQIRAELRVGIEKVRADLTEKIAQTQASLLKWSFLFWLCQFAAIIAILWRVWPKQNFTHLDDTVTIIVTLRPGFQPNPDTPLTSPSLTH